MRKIKKIVGHIRGELHDAECYAMDAQIEKDDDRNLSDLYIMLAGEELKHADIEHEQIVRMINQRKAAGQIVNQAMLAIWEFQHEQIVEEKEQIRRLISEY